MALSDRCSLDEEWKSLDENAKKEITYEQFVELNRKYYCETLCKDWSCHAKREPNYKS
jgi:hypothetical protein